MEGFDSLFITHSEEELTMSDPFIRTRLLVGVEPLERLRRARVAVFGVGGVGGTALRPWRGQAWAL